jgi:hypothetical protein
MRNISSTIQICLDGLTCGHFNQLAQRQCSKDILHDSSLEPEIMIWQEFLASCLIRNCNHSALKLFTDQIAPTYQFS